LVGVCGANAEIRPHAIYGDDDRTPVDSKLSSTVLRQADAVAALIPLTNLTPTADGSYKVDSDTFGHDYGLCPEERFFDQPDITECTGFLIGPDRLATAGHCVTDRDLRCPKVAWVFDYRMDRIQWDGQSFHVDANNLYKCSKVLGFASNRDLDFAVVQLDRPVRGRTPLVVDPDPHLTKGYPLTGLGFPSGLPMMWDAEGSVRAQNGLKIESEIDTFDGNSGSPILSAVTQKVLGILIEGKQDYRYNRKRKCTQLVRCETEDCGGEVFISGQVLAPWL
jgi:V8-like Glu-specific endopeptidase